LEAVNPVVEGKARCKQYYKGDTKGDKVMSIQIHGDAAFPGQGVVYESINMSGLPDYSTGGTVHVVINNQIGFTTDPRFSRSGIYCTDPVKINGAPIFHVNGDDPEAVVRCMKLAAEYRSTFHSDVCVDIVSYRRFGHNEIDDPAFTQPKMYHRIRKEMQPCLDIYKSDLLSKNIISEGDFQSLDKTCSTILEKGFADRTSYVHRPSDWLESRWKDFKGPAQLARIKPTGIKVDVIKKIGAALTKVPEGFAVHKNVQKIITERQQMFETGKGFDWATAESLAFGSLLLEGNHVRIAGQDVQRGTFSQRHIVWTDQNTNQKHIPLNHMPGAREQIHPVNSNLSEYACMGFELGYSLETPNALVCWEGQFGDFANGAQIIIDQFLSCGEQKWFRQTGLTLLLPHGYEGQGPEHSSARLERFLQLSDSDPDVVIRDREDLNQRSNWAVVNCSTPANYFHVLRQQIHREYRKPLVIMTPKYLLRHKLCKSDIDAFDDQGNDQGFEMVIGETSADLVANDKIRRVIFCSGKVYYDLLEERTSKSINDVALVRIEQLAPFPFQAAMTELAKYPNASVVWAQEEHKNMGGWHYMFFALSTAIREVRGRPETPKYVGRQVAASPATGSTTLHKLQQAKLLRDAFANDL
jgi:2-oxoglutarate dehydrogenase E1 component